MMGKFMEKYFVPKTSEMKPMQFSGFAGYTTSYPLELTSFPTANTPFGQNLMQ
jgi:hypothetical protein